jgi:cytochrome c oxidase cbb3-type subunit 3
MISWQAQLKPADMQQLASFILSLKGTKPAGGKEPQGEFYAEEGMKRDSIKTDSSAVTTIAKDSIVAVSEAKEKK